ncbi:hypothetical protein AAFF_G00261250 [Aldrovandia affinis]|uniref:CNH domain-containing protein n=1 Tax=Aldrovandia affinis TaxID=143900 RepID=A0AAD7RCE0_9TELE|nr:hypothetical protein AAFF_G00261250 [Aldrovandia affinis]
MSLKAFVPTLILEKPTSGKERDKSGIQCLEVCGKNLYLGGRDSLVQHFVLPGADGPGAQGRGAGVREARRRQLGSRSPILQLGAIPLLNHLLVLSDGSLSALNMFSLEALPGLRRIRAVSLFRLHGSEGAVELFTVSARKKAASVHVVAVDRWECVREVPFPQEPLGLAVDGACLCVATGDRYFLHDREAEATLDLFPHDSPKHAIVLSAVGNGEFLLHAPGALGMFVSRRGVSCRPPVQLSEGVLGAAVHFPYVLTLSCEALCIYSILDQRLKQTVPLHRAKGLLSTPESVFVFSEREVHCLSPVPLQEQIRALVASERVDEALSFVQGVESLLPEDSYKALHRNLTRMAGFVKFYQEDFSEAKDLFIKSDLDPRELISLYPELSPLCEDFKSQHSTVFNARELQTLGEGSAECRSYRSFLADFLRTVRRTDQSHGCQQGVDGALLKLYAMRGESAELVDLLSSLNNCVLSVCVPCLEHHRRFFALGLLYQSHGQDHNAIQTWVDVVNSDDPDSSSFPVYEHIVNLLRQQKDGRLVWRFADWALQKSQEVGVQIFSGREEDSDPLGEEEVLGFLTKYPLALVLYLEHLVYALKSKKERHHTLLAMTYVTQVLQAMETGKVTDTPVNPTRDKLQRFLRESTSFSTAVVQERIRLTCLYEERALLHGVAGEHSQALSILVHEKEDPQAAEDYCEQFGRPLYHVLLGLYLDPARLAPAAAADLLNRNTAAFDPVAVLRALPGAWSLTLVSRYLSESVRGLSHRRKMGRVERSLAKVEHLRHACTRTAVTRGMVKVERGQVCQRCGRSLTEPQFLRSLRGELIHTHCWSNEQPPT